MMLFSIYDFFYDPFPILPALKHYDVIFVVGIIWWQ